ncbi:MULTISPECIES: hypothetical protein [unclassified Sulfitobacter]|uniref:hypothetical protein n=1 Tax=unclassified Sulfitobacter TaxID=196795 RepID=UPI0004E29352|nr:MULTISPECIES: hypothetical protein [unclassified Sulfitobacter]PTA98880.1 hypothetical protein C8254_10435 [Sulfitobacter sp. CB-A]ULO19002.1 hypothetical protein IV89_001994 [Sulfitobacter sp. CB2047]
MKIEDEYAAAFSKLEAAVAAFAEVLERSPLALSAIHIERDGATDYTLMNRTYYETLDAKAAAWDEGPRDVVAEDVAEAYLLARIKRHAEGGS